MNWVILCFVLISAGCQNKQIQPQQPTTIKNYVSLDLEYPGYQNILRKLDAFLGTSLKNRGEAHITVITPPEFKTLTPYIAAETLHNEWDQWGKKSFKHLCVGEGRLIENDKTLSTYYVVVEATDLLAFREYIKTKYKATDFTANVFYPHITLGFTEKDLHFEQGIVKDRKSCPKKLQPLLIK